MKTSTGEGACKKCIVMAKARQAGFSRFWFIASREVHPPSRFAAFAQDRIGEALDVEVRQEP